MASDDKVYWPPWRLPAFIAVLLSLCCPDAVIWRVRTIVITAFNRMHTRGLWSKIDQKILERVQPSVAYADAACPVVLEHWGFWIQTAGFHGLPASIFRRFVAVHRMPMGLFSLGCLFSVVASARLCMTTTQMTEPDDKSRAALALAHNAAGTLAAWLNGCVGFCQHDQAPEPTRNQFLECRQ